MVVKINAIEVAEGRGPELEERFAKRAREVEGMPGFLGFELLRPAKGETRYFVYTRWETEEDFRAWVESSAFTRGHAQAAKDSKGTVAHGSALMEFEVVELVAPALDRRARGGHGAGTAGAGSVAANVATKSTSAGGSGTVASSSDEPLVAAAGGHAQRDGHESSRRSRRQRCR